MLIGDTHDGGKGGRRFLDRPMMKKKVIVLENV